MFGVIRSSAGSLQPEIAKELRDIEEFWNQFNSSDELAAAHWSVLGPLEREATEALYQNPPDLVAARSATARALAHLSETDTL
jgi:hypothetical protein